MSHVRSLGSEGVFYWFDLDSPVVIYEESCPSWVVFLANTYRVLCNIKIFPFLPRLFLVAANAFCLYMMSTNSF